MRKLVLPLLVLLASPALAQNGKAAPKKAASSKKKQDAKKADEKKADSKSPPPDEKKATGETGPSQQTASPQKEDVAPAQKPKTRFFEGMGRSAEEERQLEELSRAIELYEAESREFRKEVQLLIEKKYEEKRRALADSYERNIADLEVMERKERLDAIAQFEEFLQRYPDDPRYTPDVMFRLAELYYERSSDDHIVAMRDYEERLKAMDPNKDQTPPPEPVVNFGPSIGIYKKLLAQFPKYKLNDAATYLLGYCLEKQNAFEDGLVAYKQLIQNYPQSRFATEAWVRIGEYYFDSYSDPDALTKAAEAYEHATADKSHPLYDKALYKLGWTYYRQDNFDSAVDRFVALVDYYEGKKKKGDDEAGGDLRNEALQYTAISFADEKWGSLQKAQEYFQKIGGRSWEPEIYRRLGNVYFDQTKHPDAIAAYQLVLDKDPLAKDGPQIAQKIVQAYERDRKLDEAFTASQRLGDQFGPGTPWHEKWKHDQDVIAAAQELAEKSLYSSAIFHHQQALAYKQDGKFEQAKTTFENAARAYGSYLAKFPHSRNAYEMRFYYAECLYNSFQFGPAADNYDLTRDSPEDVKFKKDAAFAAVLARQKEIEQAVKAGKMEEYRALKSNERPEGEVPKPIPFEEPEERLVKASDAYVKVLPDDEKTPGIAYKAAELYYAHNQFDEARKRFESIVQTYPKNEVAKYATNLIVESFLVTKDWKAVEETSARLAQNKDVIDPKSDLFKDLVKFKLAGRFKLADQLMSEGKYEEAAAKYIDLVNEEPKHEFADKALNNAAVAYENTRRFDSALKLYERIFKEYPNSALADSALFRVAVNAENSYDFDKATDNYQRLVHDYPASKNREAALFNQARLLEGQQRYNEAAAAFLRYADLFPKAEDAPKNQFRAALILEKQQDYRGEIRALDEFVKKFSGNAGQVELVIDAKRRMAEAQQKLGNDREAKAMFAAAADDFDKKALKPDTQPIAADAAAQSRFQLAEYELQEFDKLKIGGKGKRLENSFKVKKEAIKKVNEAYKDVFKYKRLEWTLAALYRQGFALERFANTIIETPVPPDVKRLGDDAIVAYQDLLAQQTSALEDKAVESYTATLQEARKNRISNEWTKKTLESLNRFRPKEFPVLKEPKQMLSSEAPFPEGLVSSAEGKVRGKVEVQKLGGDEK